MLLGVDNSFTVPDSRVGHRIGVDELHVYLRNLKPSTKIHFTMRAAAYTLAATAVGSTAAATLEPRQGSGNSTIRCAPIPSPFPSWQQLPQQSTLPDPFLPLKYTTPDDAQAVMAGQGKGRVQTRDEWYRCRQPEIMQLLQTYQYGYYPDHAQETVKASRSGSTLNITVTAGGKTGSFKASFTLPPGASASKPAPVVINIGGMQNQPYLSAGIAIAQFDYTAVAPDSNAKTGAFWSLYNGRDIGEFWAVPLFLSNQN
jgi:hypothetical protein